MSPISSAVRVHIFSIEETMRLQVSTVRERAQDIPDAEKYGVP